MISRDGIASMADLRAFAYVAQPFQRWQCWSIKQADWSSWWRWQAGDLGYPLMRRQLAQ
jgi:hypothetical protein